MSDSALERHRLQKGLRRAGVDARDAVDPWAAEAALARGWWDVVVWAAPRLDGLARSLATASDAPETLLVLEPGASAGRVVDALEHGFADSVRADAPWGEVVARTAALGRRARERRALTEAHHAFRELADGSRDLLMRLDPGGVVLFASAAAREVLGRPAGDLVGRRALDLCHPDELPLLQRALEGDVAATGPHPVSHRLRAPTGAWVWMETTVRAVRDPSGRLLESHTDSREVTARMRREAERAGLARVTAAVAGSAGVPAVAALVAREAAGLAGGEAAAVVRFHGDEGMVVGAVGPAWRPGDRVPLGGASAPVLVAPVIVAGRPWGAVMTPSGARPIDRGRERLRPQADLMALAVANTLAQERLVALATTDPLTGLANRRAFHERLGDECARAGRTGAALSLVLIDLDHFKAVNDTHGHQVGDEVLREVARRLRAISRREDVVARFGGEELAWLLPDAGLDDAVEAADRLRRDIGGRPFAVAGRITASLGVAERGPDGPAGLVRRADLALYRAKGGGRDACVAAGPGVPVTAAPSV